MLGNMKSVRTRVAKRLCGGLLVLIPFLLTTSAAYGQLKAPALQASDKVDAVAVVVTRSGPYPQTIEHRTGPILLAVVNRSGLIVDTFSLVQAPVSGQAASSAAAPSLLDLHSTATKQRDSQLIDPLPGSYQLRFLSHPDWVVDITITAN
jgi:hypothetical protein